MIAGIVSWLLEKKSLNLFLMALGVAIIPAIFSSGFHHPDEQFSILELMNYKLGNVGPEIFNWDFHLKIRPFFQVALYTIGHHILSILGLDNPFFVAGAIRYFNLSLGLFSVYFLCQSPLFDLDDDRRKKAFLVVIATWFVSYIFVRTSSESLSASLALLALGLFGHKENGFKVFLAGLLFGLSFATRFQMGIVALSLFIWFGLHHLKTHLKQIILYCVGVIVGAAALGLFDFWGYGEWVFSPWNYLHENLVEGKVNSFGVKPIWYFFSKGLVKGALLPALLCLLGTLVFLKRNLRSPWPFIILPYLVVHSLIGHKEIRFINFLFVLTPLLAYMVWDKWTFKGKSILFKLALVINFFALVRVFFFPVYKPLKIYKEIYSRVPSTSKLVTLRNKDGNSLKLQMRFYTKDKQELEPVDYESLKESQEGYFLVTSRFDERERAQALGCQEKQSIYPHWVYDFNYFNWLKRSAIWSLWGCQPKG